MWPCGDRQGGDRDDQRQFRRAVDREGESVAEHHLAAVEEERRHSSDDQEERDEHRHLEHRGGAGGERVQVERHPARDEEERNQQAVADGGQLRVEDGDLPAAECHAGDHARHEPAEKEIEAELGGQGDEAEDEHNGQAHRQLARGLEGLLDQGPAAPSGAHRQQAGDHGEGDKDHEDHRFVQRVPGRQDQGDQQDRAKLPNRSCAEEVRPEGRPHLSGVAQDRDQGADRGRRHRRSGVEEGENDPGRRQRAPDPIGQGERDAPSDRGELQGAALDPVEVDLVAREEEEHP